MDTKLLYRTNIISIKNIHFTVFLMKLLLIAGNTHYTVILTFFECLNRNSCATEFALLIGIQILVFVGKNAT